MQGVRQFSAHLTKCHACHGICTLSPVEAALTMRFAKNTQHDSSKVLRLPRNMTMEVAEVPAPATKTGTHLLKTSQKYCACHTKRLSTRYETRLNVTKCHACHAKRGYATLETSKSDPCCRTCHRHCHSDLARPPANGCERWATSSEHTLNPQTPELNGNPCYAFGKKTHLFYVKLPKCRGCTKEMSLRWDEILSQKESMLGPVRFCLEYKLGPSYFSTCILASHWASQVV